MQDKQDKQFEKRFVDPKEIYLPNVMNPRLINQGFVQSLIESMRIRGFLVEYPVGVFETKGLTCVDTALPFVCFSGMHRTTAGQLAKLDEIFCHVYTGTDDEFIEMMMTANFEYDPVQNSELGQVFSQREKRKACMRLLYIPKFFRMTNTALAELWNTSEGNTRRWRGEVVDSLKVSEKSENVIGEIPETLQRMGITHERLLELKAIDESTEREDAEGNTVKVRSKPKEMSLDEKREFWGQLRDDAGYYDDGWLEEHGIVDWDYVCDHIAEKYDIKDSSFSIYQHLSTQQLRQIQRWILTDDAEFIAGCKVFVAQAEVVSDLREKLSEACSAVKKWLLGEFVQGGEYSAEFRECKKAFSKAVRAAGYDEFYVSAYDYSDRDNAERLTVFLETANAVQSVVSNAIDVGLSDVPDTSESFWVSEFAEQMQKKRQEKREKLEQKWFDNRKALTDALVAYPRDIATSAFCMAMDSAFYEKDGTHANLFEKTELSKRVHNDTLQSQISHFKAAVEGLEKDKDWVKLIPDEDVPQGMIASSLDTIPLSEIYAHVIDRVDFFDGIANKDDVMVDLANVLGKASCGDVGTQLYLLMEYADFISREETGTETEDMTIEDLKAEYGMADLSLTVDWKTLVVDPNDDASNEDFLVFDKFGSDPDTPDKRMPLDRIPVRLWRQIIKAVLKAAIENGCDLAINSVDADVSKNSTSSAGRGVVSRYEDK